MSRKLKYNILKLLLFIASSTAINSTISAQRSSNDTIQTFAVIYEGDTIEAKTLEPLLLKAWYNAAQMRANAKWTRLRNAIYVTYPFAKRAGRVINELNVRLANINDKDIRKQ